MKCFLILFFLLGCSQYPKDPDKTLENAKSNLLIAGYSVNPPWVIEGQNGARGIEGDLIREYAELINAEIKWINNTENELFRALIEKKLDLVIAGLTDDTPWKKEKIGMTRPYLKTGKKKHIMAVKEGENAFLASLEKFLISRKDVLDELSERYKNYDQEFYR